MPASGRYPPCGRRWAIKSEGLRFSKERLEIVVYQKKWDAAKNALKIFLRDFRVFWEGGDVWVDGGKGVQISILICRF